MRATHASPGFGRAYACRVRILGKHKKTRVLITLAVEREDGYLWSEPKLNRRITLVR